MMLFSRAFSEFQASGYKKGAEFRGNKHLFWQLLAVISGILQPDPSKLI
jgi:hypothetical protein